MQENSTWQPAQDPNYPPHSNSETGNTSPIGNMPAHSNNQQSPTPFTETYPHNPVGTTYPAGNSGATPTGYGQYGTPDIRTQTFTSGWKTVIPMRPLGIADTIDAIIRIVKFNPKAFFLFPLVVSLLGSTISAVLMLLTGEAALLSVLSYSETNSTTPKILISSILLLIFTMGFISILEWTITQIAGTRATLASVRGYKLGMKNTWQITRPNLFSIGLRLVGLTIVLTFLLALVALIVLILIAVLSAIFYAVLPKGSGLLILANIIIAILVVIAFLFLLTLTIRLLIAPAVVVGENGKVFASLSRAWHLTKGSNRYLLGLTLLSILIMGAISGVLSIAFNLIPLILISNSSASVSFTAILISSLSSFLIGALLLPFTTAFINVVYVNMRFRRENFHQALLFEASQNVSAR